MSQIFGTECRNFKNFWDYFRTVLAKFFGLFSNNLG